MKLRFNIFIYTNFLASATVELTVQRNYKMQQRPSSVSVGPSTPLAQRGGITGPKPVDVWSQYPQVQMSYFKRNTFFFADGHISGT